MSDLDKLANLALGRIFRLAARPTQSGDVEEYYRCRAIILDAYEARHGRLPVDHSPDYTRDRLKGAQGDA